MVVGDLVTGTEVLVIGAGPGGYEAAARLGRTGKEVTLVDAAELGGVCLNRGCIPSKALIRAANAYHDATAMGAMGIALRDLALDFTKLQAWKAQVMQRLRQGVAYTEKQAGVTVVQGRARFLGPDRVAVETESGQQTYRFQHCVIATGSLPASIPGFAFDGRRVIDSTGALELSEVPAELVVIGGGYIGLELGTAYAKLGSKVTVLEALDRLLPTVDPELVAVVTRRMRQLGIGWHTGARAAGWREEGGKALVEARAGGQDLRIPADRILVATGRRPNSAGLGLEEAGVEVDERGFIRTDASCRTAVANCYAIGDVRGEPMLAHKATREAMVVAEAIEGRNAAMDVVAIPAVIFTDPEISTVGLTEEGARAAGIEPVVGRFPFAASGRAVTLGQRDGFVKVVAARDDGRLLGVHIVGPEAAELIHAAALALEMGAQAEDLALTVHPHPTLSEGLMLAAEAAAREAG